MRKQPKSVREARKKLAAERTAWNRYRITDKAEVDNRLGAQHAGKKFYALKTGTLVPTDADLAVAIAQNDKRRAKFRGELGKYLPHQGARECERRRG